jgi:hypothetical protein
VDGELARQHLRYTELYRLRDELQRIRSDVAEAWGKIQPRLDADRPQALPEHVYWLFYLITPYPWLLNTKTEPLCLDLVPPGEQSSAITARYS